MFTLSQRDSACLIVNSAAQASIDAKPAKSRSALMLAIMAACAATFLLGGGVFAQDSLSDKSGSTEQSTGSGHARHHGSPRHSAPRISGQCRNLAREACYPNCSLTQRRANMIRWNQCMARTHIPGWSPLPVPTS